MKSDLQAILAGILEALGSAALVTNRDGRVLLRNAAAASLLGPGELLTDILDVTSDREMSWDQVNCALSEGEPHVTYRNVSLSASGGRQLAVDVSVRPFECKLLEPSPEDGECVMVLIEDVSARISMERRLAASERLAATGSLAAKVAHELNNPLDGVMRYLGLAQRTCGPDAVKYLDGARDGLVRMTEIIRGLLDQGRPWQNAGERTPVDRLLDEAVSVMQPRAHSLGVSVICDFDDRAAGVVEGSVFQVFCNIIKNALDAMKSGGRLKITLSPADRGCEIVFEDTGCGMTAEEADVVFDPFYTTKPSGEGIGLGLALCREILQHLGGSIEASPSPSGGAIFRVRLPLHPAWGHGAPEKQELP